LNDAHVPEPDVTTTLSPGTRSDDDLDVMFAALADPTRRSIVAHLTNGEATVNELAEPFAMSVQAVSKHIQVLERAGLISRSRRRQTRPCRLEPDALRAATNWIDEQRQVWTERFDQLGQHLSDLQPNRNPT
jgi:DNA-binding transcriptional ArsR family regulator